jgi:hypothetical protein
MDLSKCPLRVTIGFGPSKLNRENTLELLQVVHELAVRVERLNLNSKKGGMITERAGPPRATEWQC